MVVADYPMIGCTLTGMKAITEYSGLSEKTLITLIRHSGFPARKTADEAGVWISNKLAIDRWSYTFSMLPTGN
jgi:hypothetical protein